MLRGGSGTGIAGGLRRDAGAGFSHASTLPKVHIHIRRRGALDGFPGCFNVGMHHALTLAGHGVRLVPLAPLHAEHLFRHVDVPTWSGMAARRPQCVEDLAEIFSSRLEDPSALPFAACDPVTGAVAGTTGLYDLDVRLGRAEVGGTFFAREHWGSGMNPATKLLLLGHAFDDLGLSRVAFRVDTRNGRSVNALLKLGAVHEGTLRAYRPGHDGARVDTAVFSVLGAEWPLVRARLLARLERRDLTGAEHLGEAAPVDAA